MCRRAWVNAPQKNTFVLQSPSNISGGERTDQPAVKRSRISERLESRITGIESLQRYHSRAVREAWPVTASVGLFTDSPDLPHYHGLIRSSSQMVSPSSFPELSQQDQVYSCFQSNTLCYNHTSAAATELTVVTTSNTLNTPNTQSSSYIYSNQSVIQQQYHKGHYSRKVTCKSIPSSSRVCKPLALSSFCCRATPSQKGTRRAVYCVGKLTQSLYLPIMPGTQSL